MQRNTGCTFWCSHARAESTRTRTVPRDKRAAHHGFLRANRDARCTAIGALKNVCL